MSIKIEQLNAMLAQQELYSKVPKTNADVDFESTLAKELGLSKNENSLGSQQLLPNSKVDTSGQLLAASADIYSAEQIKNANAEQNTMTQTAEVLSKWDSYANEISKSKGKANLQEAYGYLQGLDGQINALKQSSKGLLDKSPGLANIIEEIDVMRVTETFKFNRGDYA